MRKFGFVLLVVVLSLLVAVPAFAAGPNFSPAIYADGQAFGTKGLADLPAPNGNNNQSYDKLFVFTNGVEGEQLPVAEAGPGNPAYNGGRWWTHTVTWTQEGLDAHGGPLLLKSYADIMVHYNLGHLDITPGSPEGGPRDYFECPLLPVK